MKDLISRERKLVATAVIHGDTALNVLLDLERRGVSPEVTQPIREALCELGEAVGCLLGKLHGAREASSIRADTVRHLKKTLELARENALLKLRVVEPN